MSRNPGVNPPNPGIPHNRPAGRAVPPRVAPTPPPARSNPAAAAPTGAVESPSAGPRAGDIVAKSSFDYRGRRYLMVIMLVGMGAWFAYDGFIGWPRENKQIQALSTEREKYQREGNKDKIRELDANPLTSKPPHSSKDLFIQKMLAIVVPVLGALTLVWALYNSRGEYRLSGDTLSVPGHSNVPLRSIIVIDREDWDRKGIASIEYRTSSGQTDAFELDDFIYEREPTDKIFEIVENFVSKGLGNGAA